MPRQNTPLLKNRTKRPNTKLFNVFSQGPATANLPFNMPLIVEESEGIGFQCMGRAPIFHKTHFASCGLITRINEVVPLLKLLELFACTLMLPA